MRDLCSMIWCAVVGLFRSRVALQAEILVLRHQLNVLRRKSPRRVALGNIDRGVLIGLYRLGPKVLEALKIIAPETVIRWHRAGFRAYWRCRSRPLGGRPKTSADIRQLVRTASACAPCTELFTARLFEHLAQLIAKSCCNQLDPSRRFDLRRGSLVHAP